MKNNNIYKILVGCIIFMQSLFVFSSCEKETIKTPKEETSYIPNKTLLANEFVYKYTKDLYLWDKFIPNNIDYKKEQNPKVLFSKMKYAKYDKWSYVSDDAKSELESFKGVFKTFGYNLWINRFLNENNVLFAVVKYVIDNSPAQAAGLKRGDIILTINGQPITIDNYSDLFYASNIELGLGKVVNDEIASNGVTVNLVAKEMYEDPVLKYDVIDRGVKKIGYLAYGGFYKESHDKLVNVFTDFKNKGVNELVLDLRYNPGGNAVSPPFLGSLIAPEKNVRNKDIFLKEIWNDSFMSYYKQNKEDVNTYFVNDIAVNLNLNRVFILTTAGTASASEATIIGLMPYMDVVKIGTTTHGKYCGAGLFQPMLENGNLISEIDNWLLSLVIYKFANRDNYTDFVNGIEPDYKVEEDYIENIYPLGDVNDAHLAKAISIITGETKSAREYKTSAIMKKCKQEPQLEILERKGGYVKRMNKIF